MREWISYYNIWRETCSVWSWCYGGTTCHRHHAWHQLSEGAGGGIGFKSRNFLKYSNQEFTLCQRLVLFYFSIVFPNSFLFLQNWPRHFACINQLVIIVILWFAWDMQSRNRPSSMVIGLSHTLLNV